MTKLSIIIPVYNVEKYLRACLDSVIDEALPDYEVLIVNDGSTDSSPAIAAEYASRFPSLVRMVTTENGGLGHARNTGLGLARGEYVLFLDSDDTIAPGALPEMLALLDGSFDICVFDVVNLNEAGQTLSYDRGSEREGLFTFAEYPELLFTRPNACNKLWRRSLFLDHRIYFPDRLWYEDLATTPRLYLRAERILGLPKPWYRYLIRQGSIIRSGNAERNLDMITAVDTALTDFQQQGQYEAYKLQLEYMCVYHELLTSGTRVNGIDPQSPVQDRLLEDFLRRFPDYRNNPYVQKMSLKYKFLIRLITGKHRKTLYAVMRLNDLVKGKG